MLSCVRLAALYCISGNKIVVIYVQPSSHLLTTTSISHSRSSVAHSLGTFMSNKNPDVDFSALSSQMFPERSSFVERVTPC